MYQALTTVGAFFIEISNYKSLLSDYNQRTNY